ncbi:MAG: CoA pyrophosphatase [Microthrixaceae bacterium]
MKAINDGDGGVDSSEVRGGPQLIPRPQLWTPGRPAPWADLRPSELRIGADRVREAFPRDRLGRRSPVEDLGASESAVLVPLYPDGGELGIVLTRRAQHMRTHRGEVSFPGGRADPGEVPTTTALREANEEIGLQPTVVEPLGELDHLTTITRRSYIVPVVGLLDGEPHGVANPAEVEKIIHVPVAELLAPGVFREERWGTPEMERPVYFFDLFGDTVWGATAALLRQLLAILTGTDPGGDYDLDPARGTEMIEFELGPDGMGGVV